MPKERSIHLREVNEEWVAVEENSEPVGRGPTARQALADLEAKLDEGFGEPPPGQQPSPAVDGWFPTISPKVELLFAIAATGIGLLYVLAGNVSGALLVAIGLALGVRVAWIEYGLFGPQQ
ncbi:hypothetical protein [Halapricum hydrolyticum]|uniref:Uncharacterized protein n=1 Tax=Halapricum hydrolyticum TaxID=2979991 RepID=A0AAE3LES6_9EURY|nr:hypothetical protein [Halapricum hydrolyticum]MCU4717660.1 hypothetical protein [Halapricum hydrolyticum]MCU4726811.1 hypothetical protein [Halapricum hydrolyticum]